MKKLINTTINGWFVEKLIREERVYVVKCTKCGRTKRAKADSLHYKTIKECPCRLNIAYKNDIQKQIYHELKSGKIPSEVAKIIGVSRQAVSFHIKIMKDEYLKATNRKYLSF